MGQKVNPHGLRVGVIKDWDSRWFTSKKEFSDTLIEDYKIREELKKQLKDAGIPNIEIERTVDSATGTPRVTVNIFCAKPGMVIGKGGEQRVALQDRLSKEYGKAFVVNVVEVRNAATNAQLVAEDIARQLENRVTFRRAMKQCMRNAMSPRDRSTVPAKGIKAMCSGRLGGADIAREESYHEGTIPLQTLRADIDYGFAEANTTYGKVGVKVWIYKGEVLKSAKTAAKKEGGNK
jgi:small subunit ribosomal protein S3